MAPRLFRNPVRREHFLRKPRSFPLVPLKPTGLLYKVGEVAHGLTGRAPVLRTMRWMAAPSWVV